MDSKEVVCCVCGACGPRALEECLCGELLFCRHHVSPAHRCWSRSIEPVARVLLIGLRDPGSTLRLLHKDMLPIIYGLVQTWNEAHVLPDEFVQRRSPHQHPPSQPRVSAWNMEYRSHPPLPAAAEQESSDAFPTRLWGRAFAARGKN